MALFFDTETFMTPLMRLSAAFAFNLGLSMWIVPALAAGDISPAPPASAPSSASKPAPSRGGSAAKTPQRKHHRSELNSDQDWQKFVLGYQQARQLVLAGSYAEAIQAFHALDHDDSPEVANYIGYAYRKLGDYDLSKDWYERALAADPNHVRTWEYYGLWHLEQGNKLKAQDFLEKIRNICGNTSCQEYAELSQAIAAGAGHY
jgi:tetratricopeptide (TPR) repeat protein